MSPPRPPPFSRSLACALCASVISSSPASAAVIGARSAVGPGAPIAVSLPAMGISPGPNLAGPSAMSLMAPGPPLSAPTIAAPLAPSAPALQTAPASAPKEAETAGPGDESFLDDLQHRAFLYFWEQTDPKTGLTKDRAGNFKDDDYHIASMAATGFGLTALAIAESRGWITREQAYERALTSLSHLRRKQAHVHGWFHHFVDAATGEPIASSEVSSIDTALLLAGVLSVGRHFSGTEAQQLAEEIYGRVDFPWMMTDGGAKPDERTLSMGWTPKGFIKARWDAYSEHQILYLLGLGSPTHPLPAEAWRAWKRPDAPVTEASGPLFTHQFSQLWLDLRGRLDQGRDYFAQSVQATLLQREAAIKAQGEYSTYGPSSWGWTASDGPEGYRAYGAYPGHPEHDGTVAPTAAGGSAAFTPKLSFEALAAMKERYGERIWGRYGFSDAFNSDPRWKERFNAEGLWRSPDVIGIDQGAILLGVENARSERVWKNFMDSEHVKRALERAELVSKAVEEN